MEPPRDGILMSMNASLVPGPKGSMGQAKYQRMRQMAVAEFSHIIFRPVRFWRARRVEPHERRSETSSISPKLIEKAV